MKCKNCGAELKEGTQICHKCGVRQGINASKPKKNDKGGFGFGKIIGIALGLLLVVGLSIFGISKFTKTNKNESFTHNIGFDKNNLSVANNGGLVFREMENNQSFLIASEEEYVDVTLVDEKGSRVDYSLEKDRSHYVVSPKTVWDNSHTYYLSLGGKTHFTDEDLYQFNKIIFTVKRDDVNECTINQNIKDLSLKTDAEIVNEVEVGDIVLKKDNDKIVCLKVEKKNGNEVTYIEPPLNEVFQDLNINSDKPFTPDYKNIKWDDDIGIKMAYNVSHSPFLKFLVQTVYAEENSDKITDMLASAYKKYVTCEPYIKDVGLGAKVTITLPELDKTAFNSIKVDGGMTIIIDVSNSFEVKPNINFENKDHPIFDLQFYSYPSVNVDITITGEANITDDAVKAAWDAIKDYDEEIMLCTVPVPIPGAYYNAGIIKGGIKVEVPMGFVPKFSSKIDVKFNYDRDTKITFGVRLNDNPTSDEDGFIFDRGNELLKDIIKLDMKGEMYASLGFRVEPQVVFEVKGDADIGVAEGHAAAVANIGFGAEIGPYIDFKGEYNGEWDRIKDEKNIEGNCDLDIGIYYTLDINGHLSINVSGRILWFEKSKTLYDDGFKKVLLEDKFPLMQCGAFINNEEAGVASAVSVGAVGSTMPFGPYNFKVLDKNTTDGTALIVATEGIECKPYNETATKDNVNISYTWSDSTLRKYLNSEFIKKFGITEQGAMFETTIKAEDNAKYKIKGGNNTQDKIFILSKSELENYFKSDSDRQLKASSNAKSNGAYICEETNKDKHQLAGNTIYWVRNPGNMTFNAMGVNSDGSINDEGTSIVEKKVCVRPAMWIRYAIPGLEISDRLKDANKGFIATK